jgi:hypothetical protein
VWHYTDVSSSQRDLVRRGLSGLGPSASPRPWTTRLRSRFSLGGDNFKADYATPTRGQPCDAPHPSPQGPLKTWLPPDLGRLPSFEELLALAYAEEEDLVRASKAAAEREEYTTPTYDVAVGEDAGESLALRCVVLLRHPACPCGVCVMRGAGTCAWGPCMVSSPSCVCVHAAACRWLEEYLETGPEEFGAKHLPTTGEGLERAAIRRIIQAKGEETIDDHTVDAQSRVHPFDPFSYSSVLRLDTLP